MFLLIIIQIKRRIFCFFLELTHFKVNDYHEIQCSNAVKKTLRYAYMDLFLSLQNNQSLYQFYGGGVFHLLLHTAEYYKIIYIKICLFVSLKYLSFFKYHLVSVVKTGGRFQKHIPSYSGVFIV